MEKYIEEIEYLCNDIIDLSLMIENKNEKENNIYLNKLIEIKKEKEFMNKINTEEILKLNVGGKYFNISLSTILKNNYLKESHLYFLILNRNEYLRKDKKGYYFIDRPYKEFGKTFYNNLRNNFKFYKK
jgi:hypothetical protein